VSLFYRDFSQFIPNSYPIVFSSFVLVFINEEPFLEGGGDEEEKVCVSSSDGSGKRC
jgi:hypothetical protein